MKKVLFLSLMSIVVVNSFIYSQTPVVGYIPKYKSTSGLTENSSIFQSSDKIGIGNSNPAAKLDISGASEETALRVQVNGINKLSVNSNGGVSVGSNVLSPTNGLYIEGNASIGLSNSVAKLNINGASGQMALRVQVNGANKLMVNSNGGVSIGANTSSPSNGLYVSGNVGFGTSSPLTKLHVSGSVYLPIFNGYYIGSTSASGKRFRIFHDNYWAVIDFDDVLKFMGSRVLFGGECFSRAKVTIHSENSSTSSGEWSDDSPFIIWTGWSDNDYALIMGADKVKQCSYINSKQCNTGNAVLALNPHGGAVTIGTTDPKGYIFAVAGKMITEEIICKAKAYWPDYVFDKNYELMSLNDLEEYINENNHLPRVPKAVEIEEYGINLGDMDNILLEKIEELTLYTIEQQKLIEKQQEMLERLENSSQKQQSIIDELQNKIKKQ
ncbi:hypothetical protein LJC11_01890 [Bacteroidales bacterium OttesenSCG-928-I21]|nr:hypothetical protein [Bacteroidales bacterium OttesenSCG-928-I21]